MRGSAQTWFSDWSDWSDWSEIQSSDWSDWSDQSENQMRESRNPISRWRILLQVVAEHSPSWGRWRGLPFEMEGAPH